MSFASLKQNRGNALEQIQKKAKEHDENSSSSNKDPRFWKYAYNKETKCGTATIRFLPYGNNERLPWVEFFQYFFKGVGGYYNNRSLRTIGKNDPMAEFNSVQWDRNQAGDQDACKKRKRSARYISNIVVIVDPIHPENNGKNFLYEYGPAIHEFITKAMVPEYTDISPFHPFDLWQGANFTIRTKEKSGYLNYDDSSFSQIKGPFHQDDKILEIIYNAMITLEEFEQDSCYKTYDELTNELIKSLGAQYVSGVLGQQIINPDTSTVGVSDPFANRPEQGKMAGADPFVNKGTTPSDPFANRSEPSQTSDPFAGRLSTEEKSPGAGQSLPDPFAGRLSTEEKSPGAGQSLPDPFGGSGQSHPTPSNDPFANLIL